jgi:hypothetical protein
MARKEGPYRHAVEGSDGNGDHDPGDSEAGQIHGYLLGVEVRFYVEFGQKTGKHSFISAQKPWKISAYNELTLVFCSDATHAPNCSLESPNDLPALRCPDLGFPGRHSVHSSWFGMGSPLEGGRSLRFVWRSA